VHVVSNNVAGFQSATRVTSLSEASSVLAAETDTVVATAQLNQQLFVTRRYFAQVSVYDVTSFQLVRQITFSGLGNNLYGLATSLSNNYLFVSDYDNRCVHRVDLSVTSSISSIKWSTSGPPNGLSLTSAGNILVAMDDNTIGEYTPGGSLVQRVNDSNALCQAVEVKNGVWLFSRKGPVHGIAMISTNGTLMKSFGSAAGSGINQMNSPRRIAIDSNGYVIVADYGNNRILVVDPTITVARQLVLPVNTALQMPIAVSLDHTRGRLYIGEYGGQYGVLVFDIM